MENMELAGVRHEYGFNRETIIKESERKASEILASETPQEQVNGIQSMLDKFHNLDEAMLTEKGN